MAAPSPSGGGGSGGGSGSGTPGPIGSPAPGHPAVSSMQGKRKALKLNFANPPFKSTARFTLNPNPTGVQNPHMWQDAWGNDTKTAFSKLALQKQPKCPVMEEWISKLWCSRPSVSSGDWF